MRKFTVAVYALIVACVFFTSPANADSLYTFSFNETAGSITGTVTGTLVLPFVSPGGTGAGSASSLVLTSIPAGYGSLVGSNTATSWANQTSNIFTVTDGIITSVEFLASTGSIDPSDVLCLNSTAALSSFGSFSCPSGLNELHTGAGAFGDNLSGLAGITFSAVPAAVPEPGTLGLLGAGLVGFLGLWCHRIVGS